MLSLEERLTHFHQTFYTIPLPFNSCKRARSVHTRYYLTFCIEMHVYMYWWEIGATFFLVLMTYPHISILLAALCHEKRNHVRYIFVGKFCILKLYFFLGRSTFNSFRTVHSYTGPLTSEEMELNVNWLQNFKLIIFTWQSIDLALILNAKQLKLFW